MQAGNLFHIGAAILSTTIDRVTNTILAQLGITHIPSYSPEARGRMERVFGTLQKRLPQELRLAGIRDMAGANRFLKARFIPDYNARFAVAPAEPGTAFGERRPEASGAPSSIRTQRTATTWPAASPSKATGLVRNWNCAPSSSALAYSLRLPGMLARSRR